MQSTFLYMLAGLTAMSLGVDASAFSKNFTTVSTTEFANQTVFPTTTASVFSSSISITGTPTTVFPTTTFGSGSTSTSFPDGQVFVCYPANQAIFTIVTSVAFSTVFPNATGTIFTDSAFPSATGTFGGNFTTDTSAFSYATGTAFPTTSSSVSETAFPTTTSDATGTISVSNPASVSTTTAS